jgi:hypothetical protein
MVGTGVLSAIRSTLGDGEQKQEPDGRNFPANWHKPPDIGGRVVRVGIDTQLEGGGKFNKNAVESGLRAESGENHRQLAAEKASQFNGIGVLPGIAPGLTPA